MFTCMATMVTMTSGLSMSLLGPAGGMYMPVDTATNLSKGFAFIEFTSPQEAQAARDQTHGGRSRLCSLTWNGTDGQHSIVVE